MFTNFLHLSWKGIQNLKGKSNPRSNGAVRHQFLNRNGYSKSGMEVLILNNAKLKHYNSRMEYVKNYDQKAMWDFMSTRRNSYTSGYGETEHSMYILRNRSWRQNLTQKIDW